MALKASPGRGKGLGTQQLCTQTLTAISVTKSDT